MKTPSMKDFLVAPSLLAANFKNLESEMEMFNTSEADMLHFDVMDGRFVPNISFGLPICQTIRALTDKPIDVHLMIVEPEKYLKAFKEAGATSISVHIETCPHLHKTVGEIKEMGCLVGVAINPHTSVDLLIPILPDIDFVNVMTVNPGFGGQKFIEASLDKIKKLRQLANELNPDLGIEVDGGVDLSNIEKIRAAGANIFVAGSAVFKAENPHNVIKQLKYSQ